MTTGVSVEILLNAVDRTAGVMAKTVETLDRLEASQKRNTAASVEADSAYASQAGSMALMANQALDLALKVKGFLDTLAQGARDGVEFNRTLENTRRGIAAMLLQFGGRESFASAFADAGPVLDMLRKKAAELGLEFHPLAEQYQTTIGAMFRGGVTDLKQQLDLTLMLTQAMRSLGIQGFQAQRDISDLLGGMAERTMAGRMLGLSNEDLKAASDAGKLYQFLSEKLGAFAIAAATASDTYDRSLGQLKVGIANLEAEASKPLFDALKSSFREFSRTISEPETQQAANNLGTYFAEAASQGARLAVMAIQLAPSLISLSKAVVALAVSSAAFAIGGKIFAGVSAFGGLMTSAGVIIGQTIARSQLLMQGILGIGQSFAMLNSAPLTISNISGALGLARMEATTAAGAFAGLGAAIAGMATAGVAVGLMLYLNSIQDRINSLIEANAIIDQQGGAAIQALKDSKSVTSEADRKTKSEANAEEIKKLHSQRGAMEQETSWWRKMWGAILVTKGSKEDIYGLAQFEGDHPTDTPKMEAVDSITRKFTQAQENLKKAPIKVPSEDRAEKPISAAGLKSISETYIEVQKLQNEAQVAQSKFLLSHQLEDFQEYQKQRERAIDEEYLIELDKNQDSVALITNTQERVKKLEALDEVAHQHALAARAELAREDTAREIKAKEATETAKLEIAKASGTAEEIAEAEIAKKISDLRKQGVSEDTLATLSAVLNSQRKATAAAAHTKAVMELNRAKAEEAKAEIESNPFISDFDKQQAMIPIRAALITSYEQENVELAKVKVGEDKVTDAQRKILENESKILAMKRENSKPATHFDQTRAFADDNVKHNPDGSLAPFSALSTSTMIEPYKALDQFVSGTLQSSFNGIGASISGWIQGTRNWAQVWQGVESSIISGFVNMALEYTIFHQVRMLLDRLFYGAKVVQDTTTHTAIQGNIIGTAAVGQAATVTTAATTATAAGTVAASSAPAAAGTSIWSFGSAAGIGLALALAAIVGITAALAFNSGGVVPGSGPNRDSVLAHLTPGEVVIPRSTVDRYGAGYFTSRYIDGSSGVDSVAGSAGRMGFNRGGVVPGASGGSASPKNMIVMVTDQRQHAIETMRSADGETAIVDAMIRNKHLISMS